MREQKIKELIRLTQIAMEDIKKDLEQSKRDHEKILLELDSFEKRIIEAINE